MNNHKTMVGLAPASQSVRVSRPVRLERDPFRGSPVGESRSQRQCVVLGVRSYTPRNVDIVSDRCVEAQIEHIRTERARAIGAGNHAAVAAYNRRIERLRGFA